MRLSGTPETLTFLIDEVDPGSASGWTLNRAKNINDAGQIVGFGGNGGLYTGFVLAPEDACLRPCTFSDGTTLQWPIDQCEPLGGELPWGPACKIPAPNPGRSQHCRLCSSDSQPLERTPYEPIADP